MRSLHTSRAPCPPEGPCNDVKCHTNTPFALLWPCNFSTKFLMQLFLVSLFLVLLYYSITSSTIMVRYRIKVPRLRSGLTPRPKRRAILSNLKTVLDSYSNFPKGQVDLKPLLLLNLLIPEGRQFRVGILCYMFWISAAAKCSIRQQLCPPFLPILHQFIFFFLLSFQEKRKKIGFI